ncbi:MAG: leucyl/phenylalanyl-tRNA--protein transferase [Spirochaetes bacterium GWF1_49_6]|nr:MAG: leucyl/phenylalanyl-tRNA--protein transferase [Spirochaetes bacterium GWF1_49_6]
MPVYKLIDLPVFPAVEDAEPDGLLAIGGDLSVPRLIEAYSHGIFPWYSDDTPILWWSPDPRFVLFPDKLHVSKRMERVLKKGAFDIRFDTAFRDVITGCSNAPREGQDGTWIVPDMIEAYTALHEAGYAHSAEAWLDGELVGGLYGVSLGACFFGESMFARVSDASKAAFITLARKLGNAGFPMIDSQLHTNHLESLGAEHIPRTRYLEILNANLGAQGLPGNWGKIFEQLEKVKNSPPT